MVTAIMELIVTPTIIIMMMMKIVMISIPTTVTTIITITAVILVLTLVIRVMVLKVVNGMPAFVMSEQLAVKSLSEVKVIKPI